MIIRHAKQEDAERLSAIEALSYPPAEGAAKKTIQKRIAVFPDRFWLLEEEDEIRAFISGMASDLPDLTDEMYENPNMHRAEGKWLMLLSVVTDPPHRKKGYAGLLLRRVIEDARTEKQSGIVLTCKEPLLCFYQKYGFEKEGISQSVHGGAVWYQMRLCFRPLS